MTKKNKYLSNEFRAQIDLFIDALETYNKKKENPRTTQDYIFLRDFYHRFFADRNKRATEVESPEYTDVVNLANKQFPSLTLWDLCMDGRVLAILVNGASAGIGSSIRVPGGILREFVRGTNGKYKLLPQSNFAILLGKALARCTKKTLYEVFDSHVGCAARKAEELAHGKETNDYGLLADVVFKKNMAQATVDYVKKQFGEEKRVVIIQTSFAPRAGFIYMGLETEKALSYARKNGGEYTNAILEKLSDDGIILSSEKLVLEQRILALFEKHAFSLDWKADYVKSAKLFWENISTMKDNILPIIIANLKNVYLHLQEKNEDDNEELEERAMLLLTNAYSGFLNNQHHFEGKIIGAKVQDHFEEFHNYPYGIHREEGVKVSEGGYPPYEISMFVVFSLDIKNLSANIEMASSLVRSNRKDRRVIDRSGNFLDAKEFAEAPVPVVVQEVIRDKISDEEWESLSKIDWTDLTTGWSRMTEAEFFDYLQTKGNISITAANSINRLREKMAVMYDPDNPTSSHLIEQYKVAMPVMVGKNRRNYFIIPFVKLGFE